MPLPNINITFTSLAATAIQRSRRGIVALILRDDSEETTEYEYRQITDVVETDWTAGNYQYIKDVFLGVPSKVIVLRGTTTDLNYNSQLTSLGSKRWNYLAVPGASGANQDTIVSQVKTWRANGKTFKLVAGSAATAPNNEGIIHFTTNGLVVGANTYTSEQYVARIAGILAGMPLTRSATYYELPEVEAITEHEDPSAEIDAGELILINDGEKIKIARGVNSLTTTGTGKSSAWKKIKIVEGMDLIRDDIYQTFAEEFVGKRINSYDEQVLFLAAANAYLDTLAGTVVDGNFDNNIDISVEKQRAAWEAAGTDTSDWDDAKVRENSFEDNVYLAGQIKLLDVMEDLSLDIHLQ